ncbi:MAG: hypothetical protein J6C46_11985 [Clostridia bacterium]|nr:hypothetical protein [Clostridia bacterium]
MSTEKNINNLNKQKLEDCDILKEIVSYKLNINDLSEDTTIRLIDICEAQLASVENKIEEKEKEEKELENLLDKVNSLMD